MQETPQTKKTAWKENANGQPPSITKEKIRPRQAEKRKTSSMRYLGKTQKKDQLKKIKKFENAKALRRRS